MLKCPCAAVALGAVFSALMLEISALGWLQSDPAAEMQAIGERLRGGWPRDGAVFADFKNPAGGWARLGYHFSTGAWFESIEEHDFASGVDPDGHPFVGRATPGGLKVEPKIESGFDSALDKWFPAIMVDRLTRMPESAVSVKSLPDGGVQLLFTLPLGHRSRRADEYSSFDLERYGGPEGIMRPLAVDIDRNLRVTQTQVAEEQSNLFTTAENSPGTFQISQTLPESPPARELIACRFDPECPSSEFSIAAVEARIVQARIERRERTQLPKPTDPPPIPIQTVSEGIRIRPVALIAGGVLLILVGVGGWAWRRKPVRRGTSTH